jgi:ATP-dependent RNA helicase DDX6/DHH1
MCHTYLEVSLGPIINFIVGQNGSGKSAILTAITICLGGKATTTNRGQSLKSFIKEGEEWVTLISARYGTDCIRSSTLSVKIKNTSDSAYQHEVYGDSIIVERHISRSGASSYKIKSASGRLISNRKADLEEICDYFALQIDNPMNVLTQDMARQFLNNSSPTEKYKFFMKGTQLEHLDGDYLQIEQSIDTIDQELFQKLKDVELLEEDMRKAKSLLLLSNKHDTLRAKIKGLSDQMAWAQVEEQERDVASLDRDLQKADEMIAEAERKAADAAVVFENVDQASAEAHALVTELNVEVAPLHRQKEVVKNHHDSLKADALNAHVRLL